MEEQVVLIGGRVVDPSEGVDEIRDIGICNSRIVPPETLPNAKHVNMAGKVIAPGFIDVHVHLREPGQTHKEDIATGTAAAAAGGFTTVVSMPNTVPAMDTAERVAEFMELVAQKAKVRVLPAGAISIGRQGEVMTNVKELVQAGCPVLSDDGSTPQKSGLMRSIMLAAAEAGVPVVDHCEDVSLSKPGVLHDGKVAKQLGLPGQPRSAEEVIVARDLILAKETGCHIHLQHLSSAGSVEMIRQAKHEGVNVTAEATPHHLFLTDEACAKFGTNAKMAPPLREENDRQALIEALTDGTIDMIATDHAPHTAEEKAQGWLKAPFGIVGIETVVPLCLTNLYHAGVLDLNRLIALFTTGPAKLLAAFCAKIGQSLGSLAVGSTGGVTVLDLEAEHTIDVRLFKSKSRNCPYDGMMCKGKVVGTY
ncbi:MAG: dihydroorotase [Victivallales bacterium]|nr:dihydroorotase [Victivallales bacterium]